MVSAQAPGFAKEYQQTAANGYDPRSYGFTAKTVSTNFSCAQKPKNATLIQKAVRRNRWKRVKRRCRVQVSVITNEALTTQLNQDRPAKRCT